MAGGWSGGRPWHPGKPGPRPLAGSVWQLCKALAGSGRLPLAGSGRLPLAGSGRLWQALAGSEKPASGGPVLFLGVTRFFVGFKGIIIFMRLYAS